MAPIGGVLFLMVNIFLLREIYRKFEFELLILKHPDSSLLIKTASSP